MLASQQRCKLAGKDVPLMDRLGKVNRFLTVE